ncbi:MAG: 16S rRNA processing protein RimM [Deltaproteobacteria bacterium]|nr:MAG: 16S rRNA processing protein RimM [Deltaproteobacteria bacterium]
MSKVSNEDLLLMGKVVRPHGIEGALRIKSYAQSEESFLNAGTVLLRSSSGETREYAVASVRPHKNILLMKLEGLNTLEEAEIYRGATILIKRDSLPREGEEEYFWHELIGLEVYLSGGDYVGILKHILPTGSNDIYVVQEGRSEVLIPAIHDVVKEIDLINNRMVISEVEGLLDLNEV